MAWTTMEIVLSEELKQRLNTLAAKAGKTVQEFAQEALFTYVEDIEDGVMSDVALVEEGLEYLTPEGVSSVVVDYSVLEAGRKTA